MFRSRKMYTVTAKRRGLNFGRARYKNIELFAVNPAEAEEKFYNAYGKKCWYVCDIFPTPDVGVVDLLEVPAEREVVYG